MNYFRSATNNLETRLINFTENEPLTAKNTDFIFEIFEEFIHETSYYRPLMGKVRDYMQKAIYSQLVRSSNKDKDDYIPYFELTELYLNEHPEVKLLRNKVKTLEIELKREKEEKVEISKINDKTKINLRLKKEKLNTIKAKLHYFQKNSKRAAKEIQDLKNSVMNHKLEHENLFSKLEERIKINDSFVTKFSFYDVLYKKTDLDFFNFAQSERHSLQQRTSSAIISEFDIKNRKAENIAQIKKNEKQLINLHARLLYDLEKNKNFSNLKHKSFADHNFRQCSSKIFAEIHSLQKSCNSLSRETTKNIFTKNNGENGDHVADSTFCNKNMNENVKKMVKMFPLDCKVLGIYRPRIIEKPTLKKIIESFIDLYEECCEGSGNWSDFTQNFIFYLVNHYGSLDSASLVVCDICNSIEEYILEYKMAAVFKNTILGVCSVNIFFYVNSVRDHLGRLRIDDFENFSKYILELYPFFRDEDLAKFELNFLSFSGGKYSSYLVLDYFLHIVANWREPRIKRFVKILNRYKDSDGVIQEDKLVFTFKEILTDFNREKFGEILQHVRPTIKINDLAEIAAYFDFINTFNN